MGGWILTLSVAVGTAAVPPDVPDGLQGHCFCLAGQTGLVQQNGIVGISVAFHCLRDTLKFPLFI